MKILLYDTLTRRKKPLHASDGKQFRFYCCGPTVYGPAHIGNFRTFVIQDVLRRLLQVLQLNPYHVRNITDVDDKTIRKSIEENKTLKEFTQYWADYFHNDCESLNLLKPTKEPGAVDHIPQQIDCINKLIQSGHAYVAKDGSVYYKVNTFPDYGKLAQLDKEGLRTQSETSAGGLNLADEYERESVADFALWKAYKPEDGNNSWESPWGRGRPGWHIECSAMSMQYLGETMDLHGGGIDLCFPHHENEIAQSESITRKIFSHHWFHVAHLKVEGEKMSKKLGNLYTIQDLIQKGYSPAVIRYLLVSGHYHHPLNFTFDGLNASKSGLSKILKFIEWAATELHLTFDQFCIQYIQPNLPQLDLLHYTNAIWNALLDDLNTPEALGEFYKAMKLIQDTAYSESLTKEQLIIELQSIGNILYILGVDLIKEQELVISLKQVEIPENIQLLAEERWQAKAQKNFQLADKLRQDILSLGWIIHDSKEGFRIEKDTNRV